jgi:antitoxin component YwqK of YwqJK toxin-antitoxin module
MTDYINADELDFFQDDMGAWYYTLNDEPYSGKALKKLPDGRILSERYFLNGYFEGIQKEWYLNGQLKNEENMKNNIQHGLCRSWFENGNLSFEAEVNLGRVVWKKRYDVQGNIIDSSGL